MTIREQQEALEHEILSPRATFADETRGRERPEEECPMRTPFQRDRDRILHCNAFRRLTHKTQVFLSPEGLGHDLGHTPFGHAGEYALQDVYDPNFHHAAQSVRVVTLLEREGRGLNLTEEVREGILAHSDGQAWSRTQEGRVVRYADKIAYMNHDIEDAIRGGILTEEDLPWEVRLRFGSGKSRRISGMLQAIIQHSGETVQMDEESERHFLTLKRFLFEAVYKNPVAKGEEGKARDIVRYLFAYYVANPHKLPDFYRSIAEEETPARAAADFISGMSDRYCVDLYEGMVIPRSWPVL